MIDPHRKVMWRILLVIVAAQLYQVEEALVALILFAVVFAPAAVTVIGCWLVAAGWAAVVDRFWAENGGVAVAGDERSPVWPGSITSRKVA